jgi:hypothetical protein
MKLAIGIGGAVVAMAALAASSPAQVAGGGATQDSGRGVITRLTRPIIYEYESMAPNPVRRRHLTLHADGAATLVEEIGAHRRVVFGHLPPAEVDALAVAAAGLALPGGASTGTAQDGVRRVVALKLGPMAIQSDPMDKPVGRLVVRRFERIVETLAAK